MDFDDVTCNSHHNSFTSSGVNPLGYFPLVI